MRLPFPAPARSEGIAGPTTGYSESFGMLLYPLVKSRLLKILSETVQMTLFLVEVGQYLRFELGLKIPQSVLFGIASEQGRF